MTSPIDGQPALLRFALLCLATAPDPRATADASCLAAAVGGLVAVNATTGRCAPDVCRGSASDVLDLFRETRRPTAAEAAAYAAPRGAATATTGRRAAATRRGGPGPSRPPGDAAARRRRFSAALATAGGAVRVDHRWIGHPNLCDPKGGVGLATVAKRNQLKAADLFLDAPDAVDAVIIASGHHDLRLGRYDPAKQSKERAGASKGRETTAAEYAALARQTFDRLGAWRVPASKVFWVSNNRLARCNDGGILGAYDAAAEAEAARRGATFVDVSTPLERHFPQPALTACCGDEVYVHLQGGGFCGSLGACANRSRTPLGSTRPDVPGAWGPTLDLAAERPTSRGTRRATRCSRTSRTSSSSTATAPTLRGVATRPAGGALLPGRAILDAVVADLDLAGATDVILGGCSAGGIATFLHLDAVAASLRAIAPNAAVAGFADSGYYADVPYYTSQKKFPFEAQNATADPRCLADHADRPWACLVSSVTAKYVRAPLFAWQSKFDADQLATSFAAPCENASCADPYGAALAAGLRAFAARGAAAGAFVDACHRHCDRVDAGHDVWNISAQGTTPLVALADWFSDPRGFLVEQAPNASYPCESCC
ncbi:pectin acetylesterase [Aureococcus anophagefferens]|nr:pectin acetylesterase [Aureococcus anophagefferens]